MTCLLIFKSNVGEKKVAVEFDGVPDVKADKDDLNNRVIEMRTNLTKNFGLQPSETEDILSDVNAALSETEGYMADKKPLLASLSYQKALSSFNSIKATLGKKQSSGGDLLLPLIIILALAAARG